MKISKQGKDEDVKTPQSIITSLSQNGIWHHKTAEKEPSTKAPRPGKEVIIQRGNKENNCNPKEAGKLHREDCCICL